MPQLKNQYSEKIIARLILYSVLFRQAIFSIMVFATSFDILSHRSISTVYFLVGTAAYGLLYFLLKNEMRSIPGHIGIVLLLLSAAGLLVAAIFGPGNGGKLFITLPAAIHNTAEIITLMAIPIAAMLINFGLALRNTDWGKSDDILLWTSFTPILGLFILIGFMFITVISKGQHVDSKILRNVFPTGMVFLVYDAWVSVVVWQYLKKLK